MKLPLILLLAASALHAADDKKTTKKTSPPPAEVTIPAGATPVGDGSYRYTDAQGKKWIYRKTPFGVAKNEERPAPVRTGPDLTTAREEGDTVYFEKPNPFGITKWQKKKSELTAEEQAVLDRQKKQQ